MANDPQHCPTCETEYVAGIAACADCGGPLTPGPLHRYAAPPAGGTAATAGAPPPTANAFDAVLARLPGLQADHAVKALLMEHIPCFVECQGLTKTYQPGSPPAEPFAVTLPVTVHVRSSDLDTAHEILASLESEDLIGEQWSDEEIAQAAAEAAPPAAEHDQTPGPADGAPEAQGTSMLTAVVILVVVVGLLFLFGR